MKTDDRLIYQLFMAQQKLRTYITNALFQGGIKVTLSQAGILFLLMEKDGQVMTDLSSALNIDNSTLTGLVDRLERSGYVTRRPGDSDRRSFRIHITPHGADEAKRAGRVIRAINEKMKDGFSQEEIETFKSVLRGIGERFGNSERGRAANRPKNKGASLTKKIA
jgi:DNA-binding MarR family transcriptional regulator